MTNSTWAFYQDYFNKIGKSKENIVHVKNFLNELDKQKIVDFLNTHREDPEFSGGKIIDKKKAYLENKEVSDLMKKYEKMLYPIVQKYFCEKYNIKVKEHPWNELHFVKWRPEMSSQLHSDCQYPNGDPLMKSNYYKLNITALIYPNDDYVGGEIGWPDYDLEIKPESGDMVMFPANNDYLHYVKEVVSGIRYTMPMWYTFDTQAPDIKMNYNPNDSKNLWVNEGEDTSNLRSY